MSWANLYHRRLVGISDTQACWMCRKPSTTVLATPDKPISDWFYICPGHLKDAKFAAAKDEGDIAKRKRDEEMAKEVELVKKEFEEKMRTKLARRKQKEHEPSETKDRKKAEETEDAKDVKEKYDKLAELETKQQPDNVEGDSPRVFQLQRETFKMRLGEKQRADAKKRNLEAMKRNRDRLRNPGTFPSVPTGGV